MAQRPILALSCWLAASCSGWSAGRQVEEGPSRAKPDTGQHPLDTDYPLCINEIMPANRSVLRLEDGRTPDWIELYNAGTEDISLEGWSISDDRGDRFEHRFGSELRVPALRTMVFYAVGDDDTGYELGEQDLGFRLSSEGGELALFEPDGDGQVIVYGAIASDFSIARATDCCTGEGCLEHRFRGNPGEPND